MLTQSQYAELFKTSLLTTDQKKLKALDFICETAIFNENIYRKVQEGTFNAFGTSVPWPLIAAIHFRESNQSFDCHLHNGDPLEARTVHEPVDRPIDGDPPFTWVESAVDAFDDRAIPSVWDLPGCLEFLERYNGLGYQKYGVNSPYLWDYTDKYKSGLFTADGVFDPVKTEDRPGCVAILKTLSLKGVSLVFTASGANAPTLH